MKGVLLAELPGLEVAVVLMVEAENLKGEAPVVSPTERPGVELLCPKLNTGAGPSLFVVVALPPAGILKLNPVEAGAAFCVEVATGAPKENPVVAG